MKDATIIRSGKTPEDRPEPETGQTEENELLRRIAARDAGAFERFYLIYHPRLFRFILRITRNPDQVEELIHETLLFVWEQPSRFNATSKVSTWVFGIAYNKALKAASRALRRSNDLDIDEFVDVLGDPLGNHSERREAEDWMHAALATLSVEQRAVVLLTFVDGLPYEEIAQVLECPENTVKTRMFHARRKLQAFANDSRS
ncbi:MAG: RNA polymerase sigma factor [Pseudomonadales bacterium]|nr:RNA polymerase sigma factor [Pseudomonadales bacterium]MCP5184325.1 RNA polymerase sigma factor [Pseudomonadales bacterium]